MLSAPAAVAASRNLLDGRCPAFRRSRHRGERYLRAGRSAYPWVLSTAGTRRWRTPEREPSNLRIRTAFHPIRRILTLALMLLAALLLGAPGAANAASNKAIWGPIQLPDGSSAFPIYRDLGVRFLQQGLNWSAAAPQRPANPRDPSDPAYRWPRELDEAVAEANAYGIELALMVVCSPPWANGSRGPAWCPRGPMPIF